jgi:peptidoglycan/LPS O-acetylase OafA/YrhL
MNFFKLDQGHNRVFGLDLLRFIAIIMVLIGHSLIFVPQEYKVKVYGFLLDGVSIFFVLSGFLIGGILIKQLEKSKPNYAGLLEFWKRRWLRTLPAYLVVLLFLLIYTAIVLPDNLPSDWYKFFFFLQNFFAERPGFFAEAWSLSIEEWFYLTVPFIMFTVLYFTKSPVKWTVLIVSILVVIAITYFRVYLYHAYNFSGKEADIEAFKNYMQLNIEYSVVPRLDSIMYGVIASFIAFYYPKIWQNKFNILLFIIGIGILYYTKYNMGKSYLIYAAVWVSSLKSLGVFLMLPFLSNLKSGGRITSFITYFSLISYSLYLVNLNVVVNVIIKNTINGTFSGKYIQNDYWYVDYILFWVFTIAISHTMYKLVEVPFIKLRERKNILKKSEN